MSISDSGLPTMPTQLTQQALFYSYARDDTAVITCNVQSTPPPAFSWFRVRDNLLEPISRSNRIYLAGGILIIDSVQVGIHQSCIYVCTHSNIRVNNLTFDPLKMSCRRALHSPMHKNLRLGRSSNKISNLEHGLVKTDYYRTYIKFNEIS
jgi:hypothetical protein